jgi:hypothetical protein
MSGQAKQMAIVLGAIVALALAPVLPVVAASSIANAHGCKLDEGNPHPCIVFGADIGGWLYSMGVTGWYAVATIPLGLIALLGWLVTAIGMYVRYRRNMASPHV